MGAVSSCCAVEDADDRQVVKEDFQSAKERPSASPKPRKEAFSKELKEQKTAEPKVTREPKEPKEEKKVKKLPSATAEPVSAVQVRPEDISELRTRLQSGMAITVLLQDGTKLSCTLHLNPADNSLSISCEDKVRVIPLSDVKSLLYSREQLKRVETRANLVDDENCVALHLLESGNCIPIRFAEVMDKHVFVEMMKHLKSE